MIKTHVVVVDARVQKLLRDISQRTNNLHRPITLIARVLLKEFGLTFRDKNEPDGTRWPDYLSKVIYRGRGASRKAVIPRREMLLIDTGDLRKSLTVGAKGNVWKVGPSMLTFGTNIPYAIVHHLGRGRTPRRRFLDWVPQKHGAMAKKVIERYIFGKGVV